MYTDVHLFFSLIRTLPLVDKPLAVHLPESKAKEGPESSAGGGGGTADARGASEQGADDDLDGIDQPAADAKTAAANVDKPSAAEDAAIKVSAPDSDPAVDDDPQPARVTLTPKRDDSEMKSSGDLPDDSSDNLMAAADSDKDVPGTKPAARPSVRDSATEVRVGCKGNLSLAKPVQWVAWKHEDSEAQKILHPARR